MPPETLSASALSERLQRRQISAVELWRGLRDRAEATEPRVGAFLRRNDEAGLRQAEESDRRRAAGESRGPLDGLPVSLKDIIATRDEGLTCGSRILEHFVSPYDATCVERLRAAGANLWGRLNLDEFAMGSSTENSAFQTTRNPWDPDRVPGGSSGGSAAAVSAGSAVLALGSDTGGSIRQPASFCGVVGLKPSYGRISRYGLAAYASSLDQIGPFGRTVEDAALLLGAIAGPDPRDSTSFPAPVPDYRAALAAAPRPARLGWPREYFAAGLDPAVRRAVERVADWYRAEGVEVVEVSLPSLELAVPAYYIIATAEASSNLARYDGVRYTGRSPRTTDAIDLYAKTRGELFGPEVKRRIILGTYVLSSGYYDAYYRRAQQVRTLIRRDFLRVFQTVDALLTPTAPTPAFRLGEKSDDPLAMYLADIYTISVNLAGLPALSVPCGFTEPRPEAPRALPIGFQLIGQPFREEDLLAVAHRYDHAHRLGLRPAPLD